MPIHMNSHWLLFIGFRVKAVQLDFSRLLRNCIGLNKVFNFGVLGIIMFLPRVVNAKPALAEWCF